MLCHPLKVYTQRTVSNPVSPDLVFNIERSPENNFMITLNLEPEKGELSPVTEEEVSHDNATTSISWWPNAATTAHQ